MNSRHSSGPGEIYIGFGVFIRPRPKDPIISLRVLKPEREGHDFELLLDYATFKRLSKIAKLHWKKKKLRRRKK